MRVGAAGFVPTSPIYASSTAGDPDLTLGTAISLALDLGLRLKGPARVYLTGAGGVSSLSNSTLLSLGSAIPKPSYTTTSIVATGGVLLEPTFGRALVQPYARVGGGIVGHWIAFPPGTAYSVAPAIDAGGGLRIGRGKVGGFVEARWLGSTFKSEYLPLIAGAPARNTAQSDLLTIIGLRFTR